MILRLAWHFRHVDPDDFENSVPARVVEHWAAFLAVEPDVGTRVDAACGIVAASGLWPHQKKKKAKPSDFMPKWGRQRRKTSGLALLAWATSLGATVDPALAERLHHGR